MCMSLLLLQCLPCVLRLVGQSLALTQFSSPHCKVYFLSCLHLLDVLRCLSKFVGLKVDLEEDMIKH